MRSNVIAASTSTMNSAGGIILHTQKKFESIGPGKNGKHKYQEA